MKILVANLGSTSFKYRLFDMSDERVLARGGVERIGSPQSRCFVEAGGAARGDDARGQGPCRRGAAVPGAIVRPEDGAASRTRRSWRPSASRRCMPRASPACSASMKRVLAAMEALRRRGAGPQSAVRRGHAAAGAGTAGDSAGGGVRDRLSRDDSAGGTPLCGAAGMGREARHQALGLPRSQPSLHRRAHGRSCSSKPEAKIISCHLGGSSSLCAISGGQVGGDSLGMSPQSGSAAQQPRRRFRPVRLAGADAGDGQDAGASAR